jgi:hypothetical protein
MSDDEQKRRFEKFFNPEDVSNWSTSNPSEFIKIIVNELRMRSSIITEFSKIAAEDSKPELLQLPIFNITTGPTFTFGDFLKLCITQTEEVERILNTSVAYALSIEHTDKDKGST